MNDLLRSFGRALASALHPRMLWLTFLPFLTATVVWGVILWFSWQTLIGTTRVWLESWSFTSTLYHLFDWLGFAALHTVLAPFIVIAVAIPLIVVTILLLIATLSMPGVIRHLSARQFASLEMRRGGTWYGSLAQALWTTLVCLVLLVVTLPLWLIPPFFALIPPLLWGWLTYRVMTYDALALHASRDERRALVRRYRLPLLLIGVASGLGHVGLADCVVPRHHRGDDLDLCVHPRLFRAMVRLLLSARAAAHARGRAGCASGSARGSLLNLSARPQWHLASSS
jgi:hypothetical protein